MSAKYEANFLQNKNVRPPITLRNNAALEQQHWLKGKIRQSNRPVESGQILKTTASSCQQDRWGKNVFNPYHTLVFFFASSLWRVRCRFIVQTVYIRWSCHVTLRHAASRHVTHVTVAPLSTYRRTLHQVDIDSQSDLSKLDTRNYSDTVVYDPRW